MWEDSMGGSHRVIKWLKGLGKLKKFIDLIGTCTAIFANAAPQMYNICIGLPVLSPSGTMPDYPHKSIKV
jgi:hypothetical protein